MSDTGRSPRPRGDRPAGSRNYTERWGRSGVASLDHTGLRGLEGRETGSYGKAARQKDQRRRQVRPGKRGVLKPDGESASRRRERQERL